MGRSTPEDRKWVRHIFDQFIFSCFVRNIFLGMNFVLYDLYLNFNIYFVDQLYSQINKKEQKYRGMKCVQYKARCHASAAKTKGQSNIMCAMYCA